MQSEKERKSRCCLFRRYEKRYSFLEARRHTRLSVARNAVIRRATVQGGKKKREKLDRNSICWCSHILMKTLLLLQCFFQKHTYSQTTTTKKKHTRKALFKKREKKKYLLGYTVIIITTLLQSTDGHSKKKKENKAHIYIYIHILVYVSRGLKIKSVECQSPLLWKLSLCLLIKKKKKRGIRLTIDWLQFQETHFSLVFLLVCASFHVSASQQSEKKKKTMFQRKGRL